MLCVRLLTDPFDLNSFSEHEVPAIIPFLQEKFGDWPDTARIYVQTVSQQTDVTPQTEEDIEYLEEQTEGLFYVVVYPADFVTIILITVAVLALTALLLMFLTPKVPSINNDTGSANNTLGDRTNKARPNEMIEEIFGRVVSVPSMLTVPLLRFINNLEYEICYMCVGRGAYVIEDVRDGDTPIENIAGAGVEFYGPGTSPNSGFPFLSVGTPIDEPLRDIYRINEVNGQILQAPNSNVVNGDDNIRFEYPDTIHTNESDNNFTEHFGAGDTIQVDAATFTTDGGATTANYVCRFYVDGTVEFQSYDPSGTYDVGQEVTLTNASFADEKEDASGVLYVNLQGDYVVTSVTSTSIVLDDPASVNPDWANLDEYADDRTNYHTSTFSTTINSSTLNLNGEYVILTVTATDIVLSNPALVNPDWGLLDTLPDEHSDYISPSISVSGERWVGPFIVDMPTATELICNFFCGQGVYKMSKKNKPKDWSVSVEFEVTAIDDDDAPVGSPATYGITVVGNGNDKNPKGNTLTGAIPTPGRCSVRARRVSFYDYDYDGVIVDEVKWRDCYGSGEVDVTDFGNVTTLHSRTYATSGALSAKERKINCKATRRVLQRNMDNTFGPTLVPSQKAADILCHMMLDPFLGGRPLSEIDVPQLYQTMDDISSYFGFEGATYFNYTFDDQDASFEEMAQTVAQAVYSTAYRMGSKLRLFFERADSDPILLFNHRRKQPKSETRTITFANAGGNDGVELVYVDPDDGAQLTIYRPADRSATKPKKVTMIGITDERQANIHADRIFQKMKHQHVVTQFNGTREASQLVRGQTVEATDNTRTDSIDGFIKDQVGLTLEVSQPFEPEPGVDYTIFLEIATGGLDIIPITAGADKFHVVLQSPPTVDLLIGHEYVQETTYQIVGSNEARPTRFIVTEKGALTEKRWISLQAINYDSRYYTYDLAFHP